MLRGRIEGEPSSCEQDSSADEILIPRSEVIRIIENSDLLNFQKEKLREKIKHSNSEERGPDTNQVVEAVLDALDIRYIDLDPIERRRFEQTLRRYGIEDFNQDEM